MNKILIFLSIIFISLNSISYAQYKNVIINKSQKIFEPEEPCITINPLNPLNIVAGANIDWYYVTTDGGESWIESRLPGPVVYGDPVVYFDALGNLYYTHLGPFNNTGIYIAKSTNGGLDWSNSQRIFGNGTSEPFQDKEWITSDRTNSKFKNNLYVSWTQFDKYGSKNPMDSSIILFSRSTDFGSTFSVAIRINDLAGNAADGDETVEGATPAVGPNGQVYISWAGPYGIQFDKSLDGGITFGKDIFVTEQIGGWATEIPGLYRCNGLPFTKCDISGGKYNGTVYINFSDNRNGNYDIFIVKSTDEGETWSSPVRVNNDESQADQFMSNFTVDPVTGNIFVLFYDRRNYSDNQTDVYLGVSKDGGETFENIKLSETPFTPVPEIFFGDYIGVDSYNDLVVTAWTRMVDKKLNIVFSKVQF
ncbi:MAG TPA: sialidase family protein [Ignavibacteria bacterium]|nr:sialidase family protein [Ignavibacteria bacterium]